MSITTPTRDYRVPVTVRGHAPGQTATVTLHILSYARTNDVAAKVDVRMRLTELCQLFSPNLKLSEFEIGQPVAVKLLGVNS